MEANKHKIMELNEHNKQEYPPMHTCKFNAQLI